MIWNQKCCRFVTEEATNFLFKEANNDFGQDLVARSGGNKVLMGDCCNPENCTKRKQFDHFHIEAQSKL